jgi:hypothetical protein
MQRIQQSLRQAGTGYRDICAFKRLNSVGMGLRERSHLAMNSSSGQTQSQVGKVRSSTSMQKPVAEGAVSNTIKDILMRRLLWIRDMYG